MTVEFEKLQDIISQILGISEEEITPEASFTDDLGADSLEIFQIIMGIEDEFGIEIPSSEAEKVVTVSDAFDRIKEAL